MVPTYIICYVIIPIFLEHTNEFMFYYRYNAKD